MSVKDLIFKTFQTATASAFGDFACRAKFLERSIEYKSCNNQEYQLTTLDALKEGVRERRCF